MPCGYLMCAIRQRHIKYLICINSLMYGSGFLKAVKYRDGQKESFYVMKINALFIPLCFSPGFILIKTTDAVQSTIIDNNF